MFLTNSELRLMHILWDSNIPLSINEINRNTNRSWDNYCTEQMLDNLIFLGMVKRSKKKYRPIITQGDYYIKRGAELIIESIFPSCSNEDIMMRTNPRVIEQIESLLEDYYFNI